jgi:RNA polymerase sigma-70 factor, ECF subfamily
VPSENSAFVRTFRASEDGCLVCAFALHLRGGKNTRFNPRKTVATSPRPRLRLLPPLPESVPPQGPASPGVGFSSSGSSGASAEAAGYGGAGYGRGQQPSSEGKSEARGLRVPETDRPSGIAGAPFRVTATPRESEERALQDRLLLAGLLQRDPSASTEFYERARPIIDRVLSRLLGASDSDYEDVAQIALYELVTTIHRFRGECPLDAWLSIVTARVAYRQIRRRRLERRIFANTPVHELAFAGQRSPAAFASRQAVGRVREHLGRLDQNRAWTLILHDVCGYDLREIGEITGVSLAAAQSRLVRGRKEVHERIRSDAELTRFLDDLSEERP